MREQRIPTDVEPSTLADQPEAIGSEQVHIRNHDHQWGYDLTLEIIDSDGEIVFDSWYYLQTGQVENELDAIPPGEYEVRATLDNLEEETLQCRIDADPEHTVVVEMGNGILSLTQGLEG